MAIEFHCPGCGKHYALDESLGGKRARCKQCGGEFRIPDPEPRVSISRPPVSAPRFEIDDDDDELPAPVRARPAERRTGKKPRRGPRGALAPVLKVLLSIVAGLFVVGSVVVAGAIVANGPPGAVPSRLGMLGLADLALVCHGLTFVCFLKVCIVAYEDNALAGLCAFFLGPIGMLAASVAYWREVSHLFWGYVVGYVGSLACFFLILTVFPGVVAQGPKAPGIARPGPGGGDFPVAPRPDAAGVAPRPDVRPARAFPPRDPEPPADADPVTRALAGLTSLARHKQKQAVNQLARTAPADDRREEVEKALRPFLDDEDGFLVCDAISAMAAWRTPETVPALIPKVEDSRFNVRWRAMEVLGKLGDARAAEALADRLEEDGFQAEHALRALGPGAEPAVLPLLRSPDADLRRKACALLRDIGGEATLDFMKKAHADPDFGVRIAAQQAMRAIADRVGKPRGR